MDSELGAAFFIFIGYLLPVVVAASRRHRQTMAITVLCVFGCLISIGGAVHFNAPSDWASYGWVVALVWACTTDIEPRTETEQQPKNRNWIFNEIFYGGRPREGR